MGSLPSEDAIELTDWSPTDTGLPPNYYCTSHFASFHIKVNTNQLSCPFSLGLWAERNKNWFGVKVSFVPLCFLCYKVDQRKLYCSQALPGRQPLRELWSLSRNYLDHFAEWVIFSCPSSSMPTIPKNLHKTLKIHTDNLIHLNITLRIWYNPVSHKITFWIQSYSLQDPSWFTK